ncbi:MAG: 30S ribosomal protein THX [Bacteroidetes bacterium]|jgi:ribosomal small subunit protein bTHX|nr:30S ribosomal protein THX [Bacteroidota bacterium]MDF1863830.1 30S ribosomal protein THX [Saprospiraceae bacterium]
MGKGDKKSRRGKIFSSSYGKARNKKTNKAAKPDNNKEKNS